MFFRAIPFHPLYVNDVHCKKRFVAAMPFLDNNFKEIAKIDCRPFGIS
jgi:hypothetical protein